MIQEAYVSFETAKLLKEKGFREITNRYYNAQYKEIRTVSDTFMMNWNDDKRMASIMMPNAIAIPTQQMAMKWLREIHKILILVEYDCPVFSSDIYKMDDIDEYGSAKHVPPTFANCKSYEEACEAAIKYCLENFI